MYNIVGFQTNLKFSEQRRVFGLIPGLEHAEFARYGVMHRNTFLNSPKILAPDYQVRSHPGVYFAGQMTGVEGYVESASSGFVAALSMERCLSGKPPVDFTAKTAIGALGHYVSEYAGDDFQPMNVTFGILDTLNERVRKKTERYGKIAQRSLETIRQIKANL